ncbi:MAG: hypothetical protein GC137_04830 [Alphaproteobacteria bacterium]|nr:hypothetical protein [Alphaproteobacteria bacterium]
MKYFSFVLAILVFCIANISVLKAQSSIDVIEFQSSLADMNRIKPLQNKTYILSSDILQRDVLDITNKIIGELEDTYMDEEGVIATLYVSLDRLRLRDKVYIEYEKLGVGSVSGGYRVGLASDKIINLYSELITNSETALTNVMGISLRRMIGSTLMNERGQSLGELTHVIFDGDARTVLGYHFNINYRTLRNESIALPLESVRFRENTGRIEARISQASSDAIIKFIDDRN